MINVPYVGDEVLSSSVGMDKVYTKIIFDRAKIPQVKSEYIRKYQDKFIYIDKEFNEKKCSIEEILDIMEENLNYPMFIKPSNSGSSVGITKAKNREELKKDIIYASEFDRKILVEQGLDVREVETGVLGNEDVEVRRSAEKLNHQMNFTHLMQNIKMKPQKL